MRRLLPYAAPVAALAAMLAILGTSDRSPAADGPHMLAQGMRLGAWLADGRVAEALRQWVGLSTPHPPLGYVALALVSSLVRDVRTIVVAADAVWLLLLLDGTVRLARPAPAWMGGVAWMVATATGVTWWSADHAGFDLVAAATSVQALGWLHASDGFRDRRASTWTGAWLGLAFLSKYSAPLVLSVPVLATAIPALRRDPRNVLRAAAAWAALFAPWALAPGSPGPYRPNGIIALEYVRSALSPPDRPGFFPEARTMAQRISGEGQLEMAAVVFESYGGALALLLAAGAVAARRRVPLLGLLGGILVLGTMNAREARYALPMVALLPVAALPRALPPWQVWAALLGLAVPTWHATATVFRTCGEACAPARRNMRVTPRWPGQGGTWPWPHPAFLPISTDVRRWQVGAMIDAIARHRVNGRIGLLLEPGPGLDTPTEPAAWQIAIEERRLPWSVETIVVRPGDTDLREARFLAPFPTPDPRAAEGCANALGAEGARPLRNASPDAPGVPCEALTLLVTTDEWLSERGADRSISRAWLAAHPHEVLRRWSLPAGQTALLVRTP